MDKKLLLYKLDRLLHLLETTEPKEEKLPDKEHLRRALVENPTAAPSKAKLVQRVSLTYNLRKRLKTGI